MNKKKGDKINILFVCNNNRFRSKFAEGYFNKINKNKKIKAESAGIIKGRKIDKLQKNIFKSQNIRLKGNPRGLSDKLLSKQNKIIIISDNIPKHLFDKYGGLDIEIISWKIKDFEKEDNKEYEKRLLIISKIKNKINRFLTHKQS